MKQPKTLKELQEHPFVESVSIETSSNDGYWIYLKEPYYCDLMELATIHEYTIKECCKVFRLHVVENKEYWKEINK